MYISSVVQSYQCLYLHNHYLYVNLTLSLLLQVSSVIQMRNSNLPYYDINVVIVNVCSNDLAERIQREFSICET